MKLIINISDAGSGTVVEGGLDKFFAYDSATSAVNENTADIAVSIYPNPFNTSTKISVQGSKSKAQTFILYDVFGRVVRTLSFGQEAELKLDRGNLADGMYFYKIISGGQVIHSGKILIE